MFTPVRLAAGVAALLVIAITGWSLLPRSGTIGGPAPTLAPPSVTPPPTPSPSPSESPSSSPSVAAYACDDPAFRCAGPLTAGTVSTTAFKPPLTFTIPTGWANSLDRERTYNLKPDDQSLFFQVFSQVAIPNQNASCKAERKAGFGTSVADFVRFYTTHPGLVASAPEPVTLGGYLGKRLTVHVKATWTATCPGSIGPAVVLVTDTVTVPDRSVWIDDQFTTLSIVNVAGTTVIARIESGPSAAANASDQARMQPILNSFRFSVA